VVHADLSPYNILVWEERLVFIDFPQAVDPVAHPAGMGLLQRDVDNVATWFSRKGVPVDPGAVVAELVTELW
jgi:RIO kinase 1